MIEGPKKWKVFNFTFDSPYFIEDFPRDPEEKDEDDGIVENDEDEFGKFSVDTFKKSDSLGLHCIDGIVSFA